MKTKKGIEDAMHVELSILTKESNEQTRRGKGHIRSKQQAMNEKRAHVLIDQNSTGDIRKLVWDQCCHAVVQNDIVSCALEESFQRRVKDNTALQKDLNDKMVASLMSDDVSDIYIYMCIYIYIYIHIYIFTTKGGEVCKRI